MKRVVIVGSTNEDVVLEVAALPRAGETVSARSVSRSSGGKGANQAVAAARLGARVELVAAVGRDEAGARLLRAIGDSGVDVSHVEVVDDAPSGAAYIAVDDHAENTILVAGGANLRLDPASISKVELRHAVVGLCLEVTDAIVDVAVRRAAAAQGTVVLNMSPLRPLPAELLRSVDVLLINEHEAAELAGEPVEGAARVGRLREKLGVRAIVITLGSRGAVLQADAQFEHVESPAVTPVDTTGCGDAFAGALIAGLAAGRSLASAVSSANLAGAFAATKRGAQPSYATRSELHNWVAERGLAGLDA